MANEKNLKPFQKGQSGNPKGRPKGIKSWSTIVQGLLADPEFADKIISQKPGWWDNLPNKNLAEVITTAMIVKAVSGDDKAARWLSKTGYGDKITHEFEDGLFQSTKIEVEIVKSKATDVGDTESQN